LELFIDVQLTKLDSHPFSELSTIQNDPMNAENGINLLNLDGNFTQETEVSDEDYVNEEEESEEDEDDEGEDETDESDFYKNEVSDAETENKSASVNSSQSTEVGCTSKKRKMRTIESSDESDQDKRVTRRKVVEANARVQNNSESSDDEQDNFKNSPKLCRKRIKIANLSDDSDNGEKNEKEIRITRSVNKSNVIDPRSEKGKRELALKRLQSKRTKKKTGDWRTNDSGHNYFDSKTLNGINIKGMS